MRDPTVYENRLVEVALYHAVDRRMDGWMNRHDETKRNLSQPTARVRNVHWGKCHEQNFHRDWRTTEILIQGGQHLERKSNTGPQEYEAVVLCAWQRWYFKCTPMPCRPVQLLALCCPTFLLFVEDVQRFWSVFNRLTCTVSNGWIPLWLLKYYQDVDPLSRNEYFFWAFI